MGSAEHLSLQRGGASGSAEGDPLLSAQQGFPPQADATAQGCEPRFLSCRVVLAALGAGYLTALMTLVIWTVLPVLWGWSTFAVQSGSMEPAVAVGDVLIAVPGSSGLQPGRIVVVADPALPGRLLSHRFVEFNPDGSLVTKGDANAAADSTAVDRGDVVGMARLRVPFVGLPQQWLRQQQYGPLGAWLAVTVVAVVAAATDPSRGGRRAHPLVKGLRRQPLADAPVRPV